MNIEQKTGAAAAKMTEHRMVSPVIFRSREASGKGLPTEMLTNGALKQPPPLVDRV
jgi:hypothetical protein